MDVPVTTNGDAQKLLGSYYGPKVRNYRKAEHITNGNVRMPCLLPPCGAFLRAW